MQGLVFDIDKKKPSDVAAKSLENGLVLITAGADVLRFLPPLIINEKDVDEMIIRLKKSF